jgi:hypothetical protein
MYESKLKADALDDEGGHPRDSLTEHVIDYYLQTLGQKSEATKAIQVLATSLRRYQTESLRIKWFGTFIGAIGNPESFQLQACDFFLYSLQVLYAGDSEAISQVFSSQAPRYLELPVTIDLVRDRLFRSKDSMDEVKALLVGLPDAAIPLETGAVVVEVEVLLDHVMRTWIAIEERETKELIELFKRSDTDGDGVLEYSEFHAMVRIYDAKVDDRSILRMFKEAGVENEESGEFIIMPDRFVEVMRQSNLTKMEKVKKEE